MGIGAASGPATLAALPAFLPTCPTQVAPALFHLSSPAALGLNLERALTWPVACHSSPLCPLPSLHGPPPFLPLPAQATGPCAGRPRSSLTLPRWAASTQPPAPPWAVSSCPFQARVTQRAVYTGLFVPSPLEPASPLPCCLASSAAVPSLCRPRWTLGSANPSCPTRSPRRRG